MVTLIVTSVRLPQARNISKTPAVPTHRFARGHTDQRQDENRHSATTNYLRPPGGSGFPSGSAITWETRTGAAAPPSAWRGSARKRTGTRSTHRRTR